MSAMVVTIGIVVNHINGTVFGAYRFLLGVKSTTSFSYTSILFHDFSRMLAFRDFGTRDFIGFRVVLASLVLQILTPCSLS